MHSNKKIKVWTVMHTVCTLLYGKDSLRMRWSKHILHVYLSHCGAETTELFINSRNSCFYLKYHVELIYLLLLIRYKPTKSRDFIYNAHQKSEDNLSFSC